MKISSTLAYFIFWAGIISAIASAVVYPFLTGTGFVLLSDHNGIAAIGLVLAFFSWFIDYLFHAPVSSRKSLEEYISRKHYSKH